MLDRDRMGFVRSAFGVKARLDQAKVKVDDAIAEIMMNRQVP